MRIDLSCASCGSNHFSLDDAETNECDVSCRDCGRLIGKLGRLKDMIAQRILSAANDEQVAA